MDQLDTLIQQLGQQRAGIQSPAISPIASLDFGANGPPPDPVPLPPEDFIVSPDPNNPRTPDQRMEGFRRMLTNFTFDLGSGLSAASANPRGRTLRTEAGMGAILQMPKNLQDQQQAFGERQAAQKLARQKAIIEAIQNQNQGDYQAGVLQNQQDTLAQSRIRDAETERKDRAQEAQKLGSDEATLRKAGLQRDADGKIVKVDRADLTPKELADLNDKEALTDYRDKQQELADATIAWRKFQSDPNNPQYQLAKDRLDNARRNTAVAEKRLGVSQQRLDLSEDIFKAGQFGGFAKAQVFLDSVSELADKINTSNGVWAKAKGSEREQAAKLNLDDDVAEYDSLVEAFTPLWARALGHSGVLTQQDVDSARAALPKAGDSKTLKDRKIARIQKIMAGEMKATEAVTGQENPTGPAKAAPTPGATGKTTAPKGVAQEDWNAMTDAERALWPKN